MGQHLEVDMIFILLMDVNQIKAVIVIQIIHMDFIIHII